MGLISKLDEIINVTFGFKEKYCPQRYNKSSLRALLGAFYIIRCAHCAAKGTNPPVVFCPGTYRTGRIQLLVGK